MGKTVAIVIPTFNRAKYVRQAINSALSQSHKCQVIVCDHGSTDDTSSVMREYGNNITYIRREKDFGPHFCWLEGILNADTDYVHLHFDDDSLEPTFIEKTLKLMHENVGVVISEAKVINLETGEYITEGLFGFKKNFLTGTYRSSILEKLLLDGLMVSPAACLYRKKDILDAIYPGKLPIDFGGNYHGVGPDYFMLFQSLLRYERFGIVIEPLTIFGSHEGSITVSTTKEADKRIKMDRAYEAVRNYYRLLRLFKKSKFVQKKVMRLAKQDRWNKRLEKNFKIFFRTIGLRRKEVKQ